MAYVGGCPACERCQPRRPAALVGLLSRWAPVLGHPELALGHAALPGLLFAVAMYAVALVEQAVGHGRHSG